MILAVNLNVPSYIILYTVPTYQCSFKEILTSSTKLNKFQYVIGLCKLKRVTRKQVG